MSEARRKFHINFVQDQLDDMHSQLQFISNTRWGTLFWLLFEVEGETWGVGYESFAGDAEGESFDVYDDMVWAHRMKEIRTPHWVVDR